MIISKKYLDKDFIKSKISELNTKKPIGYIKIDNFIEEEFYKKCSDEVLLGNINVLNINKGDKRINKSIYIKGENLYKLNNFLQSEKFEKYLSIYFKNKLNREFYVNETILKNLGMEQGILGQIYEKGDFYDWHVDGLEEGISLGTFTYYLSGYSNDLDNYGGELELGKGEWGNIKSYEKIKPTNNSLILLLYSEKAFHRVTKVKSDNLKRISIQATLKIKK